MLVEAGFSRDRDGGAVGKELEQTAEYLVNATDCNKVVIFDGESEHAGYWSKRSGIGQSVIDGLLDRGYKPTYFGTQEGKGYLEFRPINEDEW